MQERARPAEGAAPSDPPRPRPNSRRAQATEKRKRTGIRQFLKEVRLELKKVDWPSRGGADLLHDRRARATVMLTSLVAAGLDYAFSKAIIGLFS